MKLVDRINLYRIFVKQFGTLYDYGKFNVSGKKVMPLNDRIVFLFLPAIIAFFLFFIGVRITEDYINILITSLSIFVGLLFSLLTLIFDLGKKEKQLKQELGVKYQDDYKYILIKELFINTSFAIALSIISILFLLSTQFHPLLIVNFLKQYSCFSSIRMGYLATTTIISFALVIEFALVLLMILKRFFLIYLNQFEEE
jgi:hypothetical protein